MALLYYDYSHDHSRYMIFVKASEFKAKCLKMMDDLLTSGQTIIITKHGKPIARLSPYAQPSAGIYGFLQGQMTYGDDLPQAQDDSWQDWDEERNLQ